MSKQSDTEAWRERAEQLWKEALSDADRTLLRHSLDNDEALRLRIAAANIEAAIDQGHDVAPPELSKKLYRIADEPKATKPQAVQWWWGGMAAAAALFIAVGVFNATSLNQDRYEAEQLAQTQLELDITLHYLRKATAMSRSHVRASVNDNVRPAVQESETLETNTRL